MTYDHLQPPQERGEIETDPPGALPGEYTGQQRKERRASVDGTTYS